MTPRGNEIPKRPTVCGACAGKGYTLTRVNATEIWKRTCPICGGLGVIEPKKETKDADV